jgi:putative transposase
MRKTRFTEEQIAMALRQAEAGTPAEEICRKLGVSHATFYRWKRKFGGLGVSELRELRQLREENRKLKGLVADLSLDKTILQEALQKNGEAGAAKGPGGVGARILPAIGASVVRRGRRPSFAGSLSQRSAPTGCAQEADPRACQRAGPSRLPADPRPASA